MGIRTDLNLTGQQYPLLGTILYIGILIGEVSLLAQESRVPLITGTRQPIHPNLPHRQNARLPSHLVGCLGNVSCRLQVVVGPDGCTVLLGPDGIVSPRRLIACAATNGQCCPAYTDDPHRHVLPPRRAPLGH